MNRRGFLSSILTLAAAPAIVRADSLMRIIPVETEILSGITFYESSREDLEDIIWDISPEETPFMVRPRMDPAQVRSQIQRRMQELKSDMEQQLLRNQFHEWRVSE